MCLTCFSDRISSCRCDGGDCCRNVGHETVPHKGSNARHIKIKGRNCGDDKLKGRERNKHGCTRKINTRTPCVKEPLQEQPTHDRCRRHTKPTPPTGAYSCCQLPKTSFGFGVYWRGGRLHTTSSCVTSSHRDTDIHQQVTINFGRASITACVTGSARVLDAMLHDEGFNLCFSRVTDYSVMQMRPVRMSI